MRIDKYLAENGFPSRTKAARAIAEGRVRLNGKIAVPSDSVGEGDVVEVEKSEVSFVSEGGFKLYRALTEFGEDVGGCVLRISARARAGLPIAFCRAAPRACTPSM